MPALDQVAREGARRMLLAALASPSRASRTRPGIGRRTSYIAINCNPSGCSALYTCHSNASVTYLRRSSRCTALHSGSGRAARWRRRRQTPLQAGVVDRLGYRPTEPGHLGAAQVLADGRRRRPQIAGGRSDTQRRGEMQPQHLSNLAHRQPPVRQRSPSCERHGRCHGRQVVPRRLAPTDGDRFGPEPAIGFGWTQ